MFMRIAIVDDNKLHRNKMKQVLKECRKKDDISDFENIRDYERSEGVYELLLLDIELKDEKGIRYIKNNPQKHRYVVYVSSYPEMMGEAFHSNVLGFIPKDKINALLVDKVNEVEQEIKKDKLYNFKTLDGDIRIEEYKILYFMYSDHTVCMKIENRKSFLYLSARSLSEINHKLSDNFYKVNRNTIVNIMKIKKIVPRGYELMTQDDKTIKVSDKKWNDFKSRYHSLRYTHE
ncbi:response regulator [Absiella sp. AM54-8XD]|nr:response regulator [Absiella sp. AM22-9]RGB59960.1 response regulator [Absiella sp. AM10-20]RGB66003.1 response regulator [Absiella sp. AM09-45]RGB75008.1 response regulator [Absiella sp. AM09-50]RGC12592.1 response regulator [Absiella sp. AM54-8XD]RHU08083.1 response regulator [Absiella sp. AM27-20]